MKQLTLNQLFGVNAHQDEEFLIINKADLPGLTPLLNNTAESLFSAIQLKALSQIQGAIQLESGEVIQDESGNQIEFDNQDYYNLNLFRWTDNLVNRENSLFVRHTIVIQTFTPYED